MTKTDVAETLYHYCTAETFMLITKNRTLRLSSLQNSNDRAEGQYILSILNRALELSEHFKTPDEIERQMEQYQRQVGDDGLGFCLSEEGDLLSQWRGYGDNGKGFAIGFDRDKLKSLQGINSNQRRVHLTLSKLTYDIEESVNIVRRLIDKKAEYDAKNPRSSGGNISAWQAVRFSPQSMAYFLKQFSFHEEKEHRLFHQISKHFDAYDYDIKNGLVSPFLDIPYEPEKGLVSEIVIGPANKTKQEYLRAYLDRTHHGGTRVKRSASTFN